MKKQHIRNEILFARYGDLSPVKHKKYVKNKLNNKLPDMELWDKNIGYHSPPARYGIYAFVYPYIEKFLLTGPSFSGIHSTHPKLSYGKCKKGNKIVFDSDKLYDEPSDGINKFGYYNLEALLDFDQKSCFMKFINKQGNLKKDYELTEHKDEKKTYLTKRVEPKIFEYTGDIWHHLEKELDSPGSIIERKGSWVKTPFLDYKLALHKALGMANRTNFRPYKYSWDFLEVFIEKV